MATTKKKNEEMLLEALDQLTNASFSLKELVVHSGHREVRKCAMKAWETVEALRQHLASFTPKKRG